MRTVTLDILQDEAINLLRDLEALKIVRIQDDFVGIKKPHEDLAAKYSGAMSTRHTREEIDKQLDELRNEWD